MLLDGDHRQVAWRPGHACPPALRQAAQQRLDNSGHLAPDDDAALPTLLRLAAEAHHPLRVDEAVWAHLAAHRDARTRLHTLEAAYPGGPADAALAGLLRSPLPRFQAEGALFAVVAGRALIADERGLGKGVQAIAAGPPVAAPLRRAACAGAVRGRPTHRLAPRLGAFCRAGRR